MLANPKPEGSLQPVTALPGSSPVITTISNQDSKSAVAQISKADEPSSDHATSDDLPHKAWSFATRPEGSNSLFDNIRSNAANTLSPSTFRKRDMVDWLKSGYDGRSAIKRHKTDVDQLRAELAEDRRAMEESKRHADELQHTVDERQVMLMIKPAMIGV